MEEKGKAVNLETDDEEEDLQVLVNEIEVDEEMAEDIQLVRTVAKLPEYVPSWKGKVKVPKDLDATKSRLQSLLLPNGIMFEGSALDCMPTMKFEDWDLADNEMFPHLQAENLMKQSKEGLVTVLEM